MNLRIANNMFHRESIKLAQPFLMHESMVLRRLVVDYPKIKNMVVVGSGPLAYEDLALANGIQYYGIDPFYHAQSESPLINTININFESLGREQISGDSVIFVFWFNVAFYINNFSKTIQRICKKGDVLFISTWEDGAESKRLLKRYLDSVYQERDEAEIGYRVNKISKFCGVGPLSDWLQRNNFRTDQYSNGINNVRIVFTE